MALTNFIPRQTLVTAEWLNGVDSFVQDGILQNPTVTVDVITSVDPIALNLKNKDVLFAKGRTSVGDGGGGIFVYYSTSIGTDNGGTIFGGGKLIRLYNGAVYPRWFGATGVRGTDDRAALQAAIDLFRNPSTTGLPGGSFSNREFNGRVLDLEGLQYDISTTPLSVSNAFGLIIRNGVLIATGTWAAGSAVIEGDIPISASFQNLTIECNGLLCGGIHVNRWVYGFCKDVNIWGCGNAEFGLKSSTSIAGLLLTLEGVKVYGPIGADTNSVAVPVATGFLLSGGADYAITNCETNRVFVGMDIAGSGVRLTNSHFTGYAGAAAAGVIIRNAASYLKLTTCDFDQTYLQLEGTGRWIIFGNNCRGSSALSNLLPYFIRWVATSAAQERNRVSIQNNSVDVEGTPANFDFILDVETGGNTFGTHRYVAIGNNRFDQQSSAPAGMVNPSSTFGSIEISVTNPTGWNGANSTFIDMSDYLFNAIPASGTPPFYLYGFVASTGNTLTSYTYNHATGKLQLTCNAQFTGTITFQYYYGYHSKQLTGASS